MKNREATPTSLLLDAVRRDFELQRRNAVATPLFGGAAQQGQDANRSAMTRNFSQRVPQLSESAAAGRAEEHFFCRRNSPVQYSYGLGKSTGMRGPAVPVGLLTRRPGNARALVGPFALMKELGPERLRRTGNPPSQGAVIGVVLVEFHDLLGRRLELQISLNISHVSV